MKMRDAAEVTLSVMGVYRIVQAALATPNLAWPAYQCFAYGIPDSKALLRDFGGFAADLACGVLLLLLAGRIADWLARRSATVAAADVDLRIVSPEGFRFCLKLVGIFVIIAGVATLVGWDAAHFVAGALTLAVGLHLLLDGEWITRIAWGRAEA